MADQTVLTTVVSQNPMYVYFDVDEQTVLTVQELIRQGKFKSAREKGVHVPVYIGLANEKGFPHEGYVDFINNQVTPSTATLQIRAVFKNPSPRVGPRLLSPGQFVRVRVAIGPPYDALLVIQSAIGTDQDLRFLYILNERNEVERRIVKLGNEQDGLQVVRGLRPRERVVISGLQKLHPGMVVEPRLVAMPKPNPDTLPRVQPKVIPTPNPRRANRREPPGKRGLTP